MNDSRVTISPTTSSGNTYTSSLQFTYLLQNDEGIYTCNIIILQTISSESVEIQSITCKLLHLHHLWQLDYITGAC